jgi:8-oxo-dGTP diphosphatase
VEEKALVSYGYVFLNLGEKENDNIVLTVYNSSISFVIITVEDYEHMGVRLLKPFRLSVKVLIYDDNGHYLLLKRSSNSKGNPGKWDLPGGKVDAGEDLEEGLLREVKEEGGLTISLERVLGAAESEAPSKRVAYLIFEGRLISGEVHLSDEHEDYLWVQRSDLATIDMAGQFRKFIREYSQASE